MDSDVARSAGRAAAHVGAVLTDSAAETRPRLAGVVVETLPSAMYKVRLDAGRLVVAHIADRIDRNFVRLLVGDRVNVELSPTDIGRGRIVEKL